MPNTRHATDPRLAAIYCRNSSPTPAADTTSPRPSIMEWLSMYRPAGPIEMRPVGEIEFANGVAAMAARGTYGKARVCAGIVSHADLALGALVSQGGRLVIERYWRGEDEAWGRPLGTVTFAPDARIPIRLCDHPARAPADGPERARGLCSTGAAQPQLRSGSFSRTTISFCPSADQRQR